MFLMLNQRLPRVETGENVKAQRSQLIKGLGIRVSSVWF